jgi:hypothetical protein
MSTFAMLTIHEERVPRFGMRQGVGMSGTIAQKIRVVRACLPSRRQFSGWWIAPFAIAGLLFWVWLIRLVLRFFGEAG